LNYLFYKGNRIWVINTHFFYVQIYAMQNIYYYN